MTFEVPVGRCLRVAPGMPTTDMARTVEHYGRLGFTFSTPGAPSVVGADFAIATRDDIELHFAVKSDHDPARTATWVYIGVESADAISAEFTAAGAGPDRPVYVTDYGMRELAHIDPDGNLVLFGSPVAAEPDPTGDRPSRPAPVESPPEAFLLLRALKQGDVPTLRRLLDDDPDLARARVNSCPPLHHYADAPGHRPHPVTVVHALVAAGADIDAHARDTWHHETALHWAASNDDVALIDALLDAGADIEHPGSSIDHGPPIQSALGYAQWKAVRRLWERGATFGLSHAAVLGEMALVVALVERSTPPPEADDISVAFWNACRAGQRDVARYLLAHGAEREWPAPWDGSTPRDTAASQGHHHVVAWLDENGAGPRPE
jgi:uncharacterized protein